MELRPWQLRLALQGPVVRLLQLFGGQLVLAGALLLPVAPLNEPEAQSCLLFALQPLLSLLLLLQEPLVATGSNRGLANLRGDWGRSTALEQALWLLWLLNALQRQELQCWRLLLHQMLRRLLRWQLP